jgi:hypothetical protein
MSGQPEPAPLPPKRRRRGLGVVIVLALAVIAAGAAMLYTSYGARIGGRTVAALGGLGGQTVPNATPVPTSAPTPAPPSASPQASQPGAASVPAGDVARLRDALNDLRQRLDALEKTQAPPAPDYTGEISTLQARVSALEAQATQAADKATLEQLQARVAALERENAGTERQRAARVLALAILARSADTAQPLKPELDAYAALAPDDPAIAALMPYAQMVVPTEAELSARFADSARAALANARLQSANGYLARLWARALNLVSVRRIGPAPGNTPADRLARASNNLKTGKLDAAVMEVRALTGPAGEMMAPWLKDAEARLAIDKAIIDIDSRIVKSLAVPAAGAPSTSP